jgi:uncharacterized protein
MAFTTAEKLQLAMLCDLAKPETERELDFEFISTAVSNNDIWALDWKYAGLRLEVETPTNVRMVCDTLDMWENIEESFDKLGPDDRTRVESESLGAPRFHGFDGNNETELMHIARLLVDDLDRWSGFKGRDFNSHFPSIDANSRLLIAWRSIRDHKLKKARDYKLSADELIAILREHIHPEYRKPTSGNNWIFDESKTTRA